MKAREIAKTLREMINYYEQVGIKKPILILNAMIEDLLEDGESDYELGFIITRLMDQSYHTALMEIYPKEMFEFPNISHVKPKRKAKSKAKRL